MEDKREKAGEGRRGVRRREDEREGRKRGRRQEKG